MTTVRPESAVSIVKSDSAVSIVKPDSAVSIVWPGSFGVSAVSQETVDKFVISRSMEGQELQV